MVALRDIWEDHRRPRRDVAVGDRAPARHGGPSPFFSIAHNALTNAFLHARPGRVEVRLSFEADHIRLSVSDDGVGLPDDYAERGHGFDGMRTNAEQLGGRLIVESGAGEAERPLPAWSPVKRIKRTKEEAEMSSEGRIRVMVVDDHPVMRNGLRDTLEASGRFEVVGQAGDGEEAVRTVEGMDPEVIVMDVIMPNMDGIDTCREIMGSAARDAGPDADGIE